MLKPRRTIRLVAVLALLACGSDAAEVLQPPDPPVQPPITQPPADTLPTGVFALAGTSPAQGTSDLEPLRAIIGSARFVALGESTHASRGYYEMKARLIRYMVEQLGFRVLAFETPWLEAQTASRYVASCTGTPEAALASLFRIWHDATVRDLLRWLCDYNRAHAADPVTFFGFDVQEPWRSAPALRQFVLAAAPADSARVDPLLRCLGASHTSNQFFVSDEYRDHVAGRRNEQAHTTCIAGITALETWIDNNAASLAGATSAAAVEEARIALIALRAWQDQLWVPDPGGYQARDYGMAESLLRLQALHAPAKKTIVWAWNWHIARRYEEMRGFDDDPDRHVPRQGARAMGSFLHDRLGADYLPIALIGYRVQINSGGTPPPIPTTPLTVEKRLSALARPYLLVDLRQPLPDTLLPAGRVYQVSQEWGDPYRQFGALVFLEHSPPMIYIRPHPALPGPGN